VGVGLVPADGKKLSVKVMSHLSPNHRLVVGIEEVEAEEVGRDLMMKMLMRKN
jgi:hypothetical protein